MDTSVGITIPRLSRSLFFIKPFRWRERLIPSLLVHDALIRDASRPDTPARVTDHWLWSGFRTHVGAPTDHQVPRGVHQVVITLDDLARAFVVAVILPK